MECNRPRTVRVMRSLKKKASGKVSAMLSLTSYIPLLPGKVRLMSNLASHTTGKMRVFDNKYII